jgi:flagellar motility protein MotE (MotC chaperone)
MIQVLQSAWFAVLAATVAYLTTTVAVLTPGKLVDSIAARTPVYRSANGGIAWEFFNPEIDQLLGELKEQKEALLTREQQLHELAARLQAERVEINQVTQSVHQLQQELDKVILRIRDEEVGNLKKLGKMYSAMSPEGAAAIIRQMDDDQAVKILLYIKETEAAAILESLGGPGEANAKRAVALSERLKRSVFRNPGSS